MWTTDESNPCHSSNEHNSINIAPISTRKNIYIEPFESPQEVNENKKTPISFNKVPKKGRTNVFKYIDTQFDELKKLELRQKK